MLIDGINLTEGSTLSNAAIVSGISFPANPDVGELFYMTLGTIGLHIYSATGWLLVNVAGIAQTFSNAQTFNATTLVDGTNINWDVSTNQVTSVTLAGNRVLDNPTNHLNGGVYIITIKQDAIGGRTLSFGTNYQWPGGIIPVITNTPNSIDIITFISDGTIMYGVINQSFA